MNAKVYFLGTGSAIPVNRSLPCIALRVNSDIYLLDVGEGCQQRMFLMGLSPLKVKAIFISHSHGDHYLGLFGLLQSMNLSGREQPLEVYAPKELADMLGLMKEGGHIGTEFPLYVKAVSSGELHSTDKLKVSAFPVPHTVEAYGFRVTIGKKSLCYTGDTAPSQSVIENCYGVDILIHEATFVGELSERAREERHSTAKDAAIVANRCNAKMLVLTHLSARHIPREALNDALRFFNRVFVAEDCSVLFL